MAKISTFDDWIDYFRQWQKDIGYDPTMLGDYKFETKLGELHSPEIEFGDFKGQRKWERVGQIPNQSIRDALMNEEPSKAIGCWVRSTRRLTTGSISLPTLSLSTGMVNFS